MNVTTETNIMISDLDLTFKLCYASECSIPQQKHVSHMFSTINWKMLNMYAFFSCLSISATVQHKYPKIMALAKMVWNMQFVGNQNGSVRMENVREEPFQQFFTEKSAKSNNFPCMKFQQNSFLDTFLVPFYTKWNISPFNPNLALSFTMEDCL